MHLLHNGRHGSVEIKQLDADMVPTGCRWVLIISVHDIQEIVASNDVAQPVQMAASKPSHNVFAWGNPVDNYIFFCKELDPKRLWWDSFMFESNWIIIGLPNMGAYSANQGNSDSSITKHVFFNLKGSCWYFFSRTQNLKSTVPTGFIHQFTQFSSCMTEFLKSICRGCQEGITSAILMCGINLHCLLAPI